MLPPHRHKRNVPRKGVGHPLEHVLEHLHNLADHARLLLGLRRWWRRLLFVSLCLLPLLWW